MQIPRFAPKQNVSNLDRLFFYMIDKIIIFGAGAAGSNLLLNLICAHPDLQYTIVDFDKVELRNITAGTQPYSKADINRPKVQALQRIVQMTRDKKIEILNQEIRALLAPSSNTIYVDCFDNAKSRNLFIKLHGNIVHVGFSAALTGEVLWNELFTPMVESKADKNIDVCQMHLARPFIQTLTGLAALVVSEFITTGKKNNIFFDSKLGLKKF